MKFKFPRIWVPKVRTFKPWSNVGIVVARNVRSNGRLIDKLVTVKGNVMAILLSVETGERSIFETENIVTDIGDQYYAYRAANAQPPDDHFTTGAALTFDGIMELYSSVSAAPSATAVRSGLTGGVLAPSSGKAMDATYPKNNDGDADNTGAGVAVVTYTVSYTTAEANATGIDDVIITNPTPAAGENMLMWADGLGSITKTASDTLKVIVNHTFNGV